LQASLGQAPHAPNVGKYKLDVSTRQLKKQKEF
jgi:hypothetical protein